LAEVIYKDDMLVMSNDKGLTCSEIVQTLSAMVLMIVFYAMIPLGLIIDYYIMLGMICVYFINIMHACSQKTSKYIFNLVDLNDCFVNI
jgi:hypothetical protein